MIDDLDRQLISWLRFNSRTPAAVLARELGVNRSTVNARIDRLVDTGVIEAFTIQVSDEIARDSIRGVVFVACDPARGRDVIRAVRGIPEAEQMHSTLGGWDLIVHLRARSLDAFDAALELIRAVPGVRDTQTSLLVNSLTRA